MKKTQNVEDVKEMVGKYTKKVSEKIDQKMKKTKERERKVEPLVTCRLLFITALDKILLIFFTLSFIITFFLIFSGNLSSMGYGYFKKVLFLIVALILYALYYLFLNWLYKCAAKTMICLTKKGVHKELYMPFVKMESDIPLEKITKVSTINFLYIFRLLIMHQYHQLPILFWTWNNNEFKDMYNELVTSEKNKVVNEFSNRNIIPEKFNAYLKYVALGLVAIVLLIGVLRFFGYVFSPAKRVPGTYTYNNKEIVLKRNGYCDVDDIINYDILECDWIYDEETQKISINYTYEYEGWSGTYEYDGYMTLDYNKENKTVEYYGTVYSK